MQSRHNQSINAMGIVIQTGLLCPLVYSLTFQPFACRIEKKDWGIAMPANEIRSKIKSMRQLCAEIENEFVEMDKIEKEWKLRH